MDRKNIDKIAKTPEDRVLLAKLWDKISAGMRKNVIASTGFLSPRELEMSRYLFGDTEGLHAFGGYPDAERKMLIYLPDYLDEEWLQGADSPAGDLLPGGLPLSPGFFRGADGCGHCPGDGWRYLRWKRQLRFFRHPGDHALPAAKL